MASKIQLYVLALMIAIGGCSQIKRSVYITETPLTYQSDFNAYSTKQPSFESLRSPIIKSRVLDRRFRTKEAMHLANEMNICTNVILTFDDGPSNERIFPSSLTSTQKILRTLKNNNIKAAFFVLTAPDSFLWVTYPKAETSLGFQILKQTLNEGHVVGIHWGGSYGSQFALHTSRISLPAYDHDGDGKIDKVSEQGNALESDLLQSLGLIQKAKNEVGLLRETVFVRPPLWVFKNKDGDARPTYETLNLRMVLTDAKFLDTGYLTHIFSNHYVILIGIVKAMKSGKKNIIVTLHDSNPITAVVLPMVIMMIKIDMAILGHDYGTDWKFAETTEEVYQGLLNRRY